MTEQTESHMTEQTESHMTEQTESHMTEQTESHMTEQTELHMTEQTELHMTEQKELHIMDSRLEAAEKNSKVNKSTHSKKDLARVYYRGYCRARKDDGSLNEYTAADPSTTGAEPSTTVNSNPKIKKKKSVNFTDNVKLNDGGKAPTRKSSSSR
jgi:hypothetical protein